MEVGGHPHCLTEKERYGEDWGSVAATAQGGFPDGQLRCASPDYVLLCTSTRKRRTSFSLDLDYFAAP